MPLTLSQSAAIDLVLRAEDGVRIVPSPPALVGTSTYDSCISILGSSSLAGWWVLRWRIVRRTEGAVARVRC